MASQPTFSASTAPPAMASAPYLSGLNPEQLAAVTADGRAAAGAGRRGDRQDPGADHPARAYPADRPRPAAGGPGGHLHQPRRARDGRAARRADRPQPPGMWLGTFHAWGCGCCVPMPSWWACSRASPSWTATTRSGWPSRSSRRRISTSGAGRRGCWWRSSSAGRTVATARIRCRRRRPATSRWARASALYAAYQQRLVTLNACDFGDLLLHGLTLLTAAPELLAEYQRRFRTILVDEYQDTNVAQYLWLRLLAGGHKNVTCVGDDDQSIYSWRGAEVGNILRFEQDFPGARVIRLERNYRSTGHILAAASGVIAKNRARHGKTLWTEDDQGDQVRVRRPVGRPGGGALRRRRGRGVAAPGRQAQPVGDPGAGRLPDPLVRGAVHPAGHPLSGDRRATLLRAGRDP